MSNAPRNAVQPRRLSYNRQMILAGDIGATKTLIGLFDPPPAGAARPRPGRIERFTTADHAGLPAIIDAYFGATPRPAIDAACFGVAGPVLGRRARLTNVSWEVSADDIAARFAIPHVRLLNDLQSMAHAMPLLQADELRTLQAGHADETGNAALIAAGTGLSHSLLHRIDGRFVPTAAEGGHIDFAARTDREFALARALRSTYGRAELEAVVSGIGLINVARFTHRAAGAGDADGEAPSLAEPRTCPIAGVLEVHNDSAARVSAAAMDGSCAHCLEALEIFVSAYGAAAGNLALHAMAGAGVYIGGGIAPRNLPLMTDGRFMDAFRAKPPMDGFLARVPVHIVLNRQVGILGAAVAASELLMG